MQARGVMIRVALHKAACEPVSPQTDLEYGTILVAELLVVDVTAFGT